MDNADLLLKVTQTGFYICLALTVLGIVLAALAYWKFNIKQIYLIRSGRERQRTVHRLEEQNRMTGKLREDNDFAFISEETTPKSKNSKRTSRAEISEPEFQQASHSGNTGAFNTGQPADMPEQQRLAMERSAARQGSNVATDSPASETVELSHIEADIYNEWIKTAYESEEENVINVPRAPLSIISQELIIHTQEIIDI